MTKSLIYEMVENKIIFIRDFIEEKVRGNKWKIFMLLWSE
jgi:hypothetical protein